MLARRVADYAATIRSAGNVWASRDAPVVGVAAPDLWCREPVLLDPFVVLPQELITRVLSRLPPTEVLRARCVSKLWATCCMDESLWRGFVRTLEGDASVNESQGARPWSWMLLYFARDCRNSASALIDELSSPSARHINTRARFDPDWDDSGEFI